MMVFGLIALIAGAASALMFASIVSGALISLVLVYLAPLPLMLAAIAWGPLCGALGGLVATLIIAGALSPPLALGYGFAFALPAWWLGHLAMLGRPVTLGRPASGIAGSILLRPRSNGIRLGVSCSGLRRWRRC